MHVYKFLLEICSGSSLRSLVVIRSSYINAVKLGLALQSDVNVCGCASRRACDSMARINVCRKASRTSIETPG